MREIAKSKLPLRRKNWNPVPHDDSGTFSFVNVFRTQVGIVTQRSIVATP